MKIGEMTNMVCAECAHHFLVVEVNTIIKCPNCKVMSADKGIFIPFDEYIKESVKWY